MTTLGDGGLETKELEGLLATMTLHAGDRLGPYEIRAKIGAGGMGEVYRARDTKLGRDVAIKILAQAFMADPDRLSRFAREARVLAALNHPNIATIHGLEDQDGIHALVMELVEGETLAERIRPRPLPIPHALNIAAQIADALDAAHEKDIVHRDLKPASDWSSDGRFLLYSNGDPSTGFDIWIFPLEGDRKPVPIVQTTFNERLAQFSPDGKWVAYESNESGRYEIYVQPFSGSNEKVGGSVPVSTDGGAQVRWRPDGKALFYLALDDRLMTVPIRPSNGQAPELGAPVPLFTTRVVGGALQEFPRHQYSVAPDGQRFLMNVERGEAAASPISVVLNWTAALNRRALNER